ncbi:hypothetical protein KKB44_00960 [Candidatus Micrarchaeota archaeon]|nr:hypothetical protein [Candidatus Micrarchaeota archaeon]
MSKRHVYLPIAMALSIGVCAITGHGLLKYNRMQQAREAQIERLVNRFKGCPDRFRISGECFSPEERVQMTQEARQKMRNGEYENAGMIFAQLGMENEAREMALECAAQGNEEGQNRILDELDIRTEARSRAR